MSLRNAQFTTGNGTIVEGNRESLQRASEDDKKSINGSADDFHQKFIFRIEKLSFVHFQSNVNFQDKTLCIRVQLYLTTINSRKYIQISNNED